jgi:hypothetical protein
MQENPKRWGLITLSRPYLPGANANHLQQLAPVPAASYRGSRHRRGDSPAWHRPSRPSLENRKNQYSTESTIQEIVGPTLGIAQVTLRTDIARRGRLLRITEIAL